MRHGGARRFFAFFGSVEMPGKNYNIILFCTPQVTITFHKANQNSKKGVKGILPLGCLPRRGREGVTIVFFS